LRLKIAELNVVMAQQVVSQFRELSAILFPAGGSRAVPLARLPQAPRTRVPQDRAL